MNKTRLDDAFVLLDNRDKTLNLLCRHPNGLFAEPDANTNEKNSTNRGKHLEPAPILESTRTRAECVHDTYTEYYKNCSESCTEGQQKRNGEADSVHGCCCYQQQYSVPTRNDPST
jgi:hypothetical protein